MKKYTLIDNETNEIYVENIGLKQLCDTLGRTKSSIYGTIYRIEKLKLFENIRHVDGKSYKLIIKKVDK